MSKNILSDAIADARAVRKTALENAKASLEEAFAPRLKEMLNAKLKEELSDLDNPNPNPSEAVNTSKIGANVGGSHAPSKDAVTVQPGHLEVTNSLEEDMGEKLSSQELDEILRELESEVGDGNPVPPQDPTAVPPQEPAPAQVPPQEPSAVPPQEPSTVPPQEPAAVPPVATDTTGANPDAPVPAASPDGQNPTAEDEDIDLNELLNSLNEDVAEDDEDEEAEEKKAKSSEKTEKAEEKKGGDLIKENVELKTRLDEAMKTVAFIQEQLTDVNLLNAKLLYTNKLFKGSSLNNAQKMKIVEAFDLTKSIREVKLTYKILAESLNNGTSVAKSKTNATVKSLTEGLASKPIASTKPTLIVESNDMAQRFQTLAGIKRKTVLGK